MRKILLLLVLALFICQSAEAFTIERHNFFTQYDPTSTSFVYTDDASDTSATGDQLAVNTYKQKSIQITGILVGEDIEVRIEGRFKDQLNVAGATNLDNFAILDEVTVGFASDDTGINRIIDVTEFVDFLRVGVRRVTSDGTSSIDIEGIFTTFER